VLVFRSLIPAANVRDKALDQPRQYDQRGDLFDDFYDGGFHSSIRNFHVFPVKVVPGTFVADAARPRPIPPSEIGPDDKSP